MKTANIYIFFRNGEELRVQTAHPEIIKNHKKTMPSGKVVEIDVSKMSDQHALGIRLSHKNLQHLTYFVRPYYRKIVKGTLNIYCEFEGLKGGSNA